MKLKRPFGNKFMSINKLHSLYYPIKEKSHLIFMNILFRVGIANFERAVLSLKSNQIEI